MTGAERERTPDKAGPHARGPAKNSVPVSFSSPCQARAQLVVVFLFQTDLIGTSVQKESVIATLLQRGSMVGRLNLTARQSLEAT
jgi:hypothetical protein